MGQNQSRPSPTPRSLSPASPSTPAHRRSLHPRATTQSLMNSVDSDGGGPSDRSFSSILNLSSGSPSPHAASPTLQSPLRQANPSYTTPPASPRPIIVSLPSSPQPTDSVHNGDATAAYNHAASSSCLPRSDLDSDRVTTLSMGTNAMASSNTHNLAWDFPKQSFSDSLRALSLQGRQALRDFSGKPPTPAADMFFTSAVKAAVKTGPGMYTLTAEVLEKHQSKKPVIVDHDNTNNDEDGDGAPSTDDPPPFYDDWGLLTEQKEDQDNSYTEERVVRYLDELFDEEVMPLWSVPSSYNTPELDPRYTPDPHQLRAAACIERAATSQHRGLIVGDAMGNGKTLEALIPLVEIRIGAKKHGIILPPFVIVAPAAVSRQWVGETHKFFPGKLKVFLVQNSAFPPEVLYEHDLIVVSYNHVERERSRLQSYHSQLQLWSKGHISSVPVRPRTPLLAELHAWGRGFGSYMVLDEAQSIKNTNSATFHAISLLRKRMDTCIMLSATPLDNRWSDCAAYFRMLKGHYITTNDRFTKIFTGKKVSDWEQMPSPTGIHLERVKRMLQSCMIGRSRKIRGGQQPEPVRKWIHFEPNGQQRTESNQEFQLWKQRNAINHSSSFSGLVLSQQIVMHHELGDIMELYRKDLRKLKQPLTDSERQQLEGWKAKLMIDQNHRSERINKIEWLLNRIFETHSNEAVVIMEESKYFLMIVEVLLKVMKLREKFQYWVYNGDSVPEERDRKMQQFREAKGFRIMLMTRGCGGVGLNMEFVKVLLIVGQWWKESAIQQAIGRLDRVGSTKTALVYLLLAEGCEVELHKVNVRHGKTKDIQNVQGEIIVDSEPGPKPVRKRIT